MAISLVQSKSGSGTTSPVTVTLTSNTTAGNCLVVAVAAGNSTTNATVSGMTLGGSAGNFASAVALANNSDCNVEIWTDQNCAGGQTAVAVSFSGGTGTGNGFDVFVWEFSGVSVSSAVDKAPAAAGGTTGGFASASTGTLTIANEVAVGIGGAVGSIGAPTMTGPSSPWNNQTSVSAAKTGAVGGYQIVSATTALTYTGTSSTGKWGAAIITLEQAASSVTGTGSIGLGGVAFSGAGSETFSATGSLALGGLAFSGTDSVTGSGGLALGGLHFTGSAGALTFTGSGTLALGGLAFSGSQLTVVPAVPTEPAGVIATSRDLNEWANASQFFLGSSRGTAPVFFLQAATTQSLTTSFTAVNWSSSAAVFKDNNGAWTSGTPSRMTVMTPGFYSIAWSVSAASGAGHLQCYAQVTTTAANPFNPSTTVKFQAANRASTTNITVTGSGGLVPIYLATGDYVEVYALVGSAVSTSLTFAPQLTGEWVSN